MNYYFELAKNQDDAVKNWYNSQYELADVVLSMTDNGILEGHKLLAFFRLEAVEAILNVYKFNFKLAKSELGIKGEYIKREGDIFSKEFEPNRNLQALTIKGDEFNLKAQQVYNEIIEQFKKVSDNLVKTVKKMKK